MGNLLEVELQATLDVLVDGRGRQALLVAQDVHHALVLLHCDGDGWSDGEWCIKLQLLDVEPALNNQLSDEPTLLALGRPGAVLVVDEGNVFGTLQQTVEGIGIHGILAFQCVEPEVGTKDVGNERHLACLARNDAFADGEHNQVREVEASCFKQSHYLDALVHFAVEGDAGHLHGLPDEAAKGGCRNVERSLSDEPAELPQHLVHLECAFGVELVVG